MKTNILWLLPLALLLQSCLADIRPSLIKREGITLENEEKGRKILQQAWKKQGFDKLERYETYSVKGIDTWQGMMGKMASPWPEAKSNMLFRFEVGSFNSQVKYLAGKRANITEGLQSWNYYEFEEGKTPQKKELNLKTRFGLSAYHYFFELVDRLKRAPIVAWAGEKDFDGARYDVVFVTWEKAEAHDEHDQYQLLINQETGMLDYAIYTIREAFLKMPGAKAFYGSIKYSDYKNIEGVMIPFTQTVFLNKPHKKEKKNMHQLKVSEFKFDAFEKELLKPFHEIEETGDSKVPG